MRIQHQLPPTSAPSSRGPLRAVHNYNAKAAAPMIPLNCEDAMPEHHKIAGRQLLPSLVSGLASPIDKTDPSFKPRPTRNPIPLRTSTYRSQSKPDQLTEITNADIRHHFPVRAAASSPSRRASLPGKMNASTVTLSSPTDRPTNYTCRRKRHYHHSDVELEDDMSESAAMTPDTLSSSATKRPRLAMGSDIRAHPRYVRQTSFPRPNGSNDEEEAGSTSRRSGLGPVCPIPLPPAFVLHGTVAPGASSAIVRAQVCCTTGTQTSPLDLSRKENQPARHGGNSMSRSRLSRSPSVVINSIKKTFGHLRRAISTERLNAPSPRKSSSSSFNRRSSLRSTYHRPVDQSLFSSAQSPSTPLGAATTTRQQLTCAITHRYRDGSVRVSLRRPSTAVPFGFCVARDPKGIYVNRITAHYLDPVLGVGDRIVQVQNLSCSRIEVVDLKNVISNCELVELRVRPASKRDSNCLRV